MAAEQFRHQLRQEAKQWQEEGLIDGDFYAHLSQRYGFDELEVSSRNRFIAIFMGLGSLLLGLAAITLVAANWQVWSREVKGLLLLGLFVGVNTAGFSLWRGSGESWRSRFGKALLLLGASSFGANLALMAQMFHRSGPLSYLFLVWSLGVLAMAWSLRLTLLGVFAAILGGVGYGAALLSGLLGTESGSWRLAIAHFPLWSGLLLVPLAYWCGSRWLFGLAALLVTISLEANLPAFLPLLYHPSSFSGVVAAIAWTLPPALLWAYQDLPGAVKFRPVARCLALAYAGFFFFLLSFNFWDETPSFLSSSPPIYWQDWLVLLDLALLLGLAAVNWWRLGWEGQGRGWRPDGNSGALAAMLSISGLLVWWQFAVTPLGMLATVAFNTFLFLLAVGLVREGLTTANRLAFWGGMLLGTVQLTARMLEYETGLLWKAIVLFGCGLAVMAAGFYFERYLSRLSKS